MSKKIKDLTNQRFGKLVVIERDFNKTDRHKTVYWKCRCDCGNIITASAGNLKQGYKQSCGCLRANDLTGKRFGRWIVIEKSRKIGKTQMYLCQCDCGTKKEVGHSNIKSGKSTSCGCLQKELASKKFMTHGKRGTRLYNVYANMKSRCCNPNNNRYDSYGGRGIAICKEWLDDFQNFYDWSMQNGYADNLTIDRIDVNGNYEPSNCRWVTMESQSNNQRKTIWVEICGEKKSLKQWTDFMGWKYGKYSARYRRGVQIFNKEELEIIEQKLKE